MVDTAQAVERPLNVKEWFGTRDLTEKEVNVALNLNEAAIYKASGFQAGHISSKLRKLGSFCPRTLWDPPRQVHD